MIFEYYDGDILCSKVWADFDKQQVRVENYNDVPIYKTVFGLREPSIENLLDFFEDRCFDKGRQDLPELNRSLGITHDMYNAAEVVKVTNGKTTEDFQWIKWIEK